MRSIKAPKLRFPGYRDEWQAKKLGDIAKFSKGANISKEDITPDGKIEAVRYGELYTTYSEVINKIKSKTNLPINKLVFSKKNDVIIPVSGETYIDIASASCILKDRVALSGDINIIRSENNGVFIAHYLNGQKRNDIARLAQGVSVVHLYAKDLKSLQVVLPSIDEQQQIVYFLTVINDKCNVLQQKIDLLKKYKKGVMQKIFSQQIRFKDESGKEYPSWQVKKLGEVFTGIKGSGLSWDKITPDGKNKCILYGELYTKYPEKIENVISHTDVDDGVPSKTNDLLLPCSTTTTGIDLANATALNEPGVHLGGDISILRFQKSGSNIFYAYYLTHFMKYKLAAYGQGSTIVHMYYSHFKNMRIVEPHIEEQQKIANFLVSIDEKMEAEEKKLEQDKKFKKALLREMFV